jgi:chaperone LolA
MKLSYLLSRLLIVAIFLGMVDQAAAQSADTVFERLKEKYDTIESLRAEFSQTMTSSYMDDEATSKGVLVIQGDRYRVETDGQTLVTDGDVTWVYMPSQNQVLINDHNDDEQTFSINEFLFDYDENFDASDVKTATLGGQKHFVLTLTPKSEDAFSMRDSDDIITQLQVVDVNGTTMLFNLENIQLNPTLQDNIFSFTPPQGTEVVDLRS